MTKELPANAGDVRDSGLIPGLGRSPGEENGNPLQYSCLENPMDRGGAWRATVHRVTKSRTRLSDFTFFQTEVISKTCTNISPLQKQMNKLFFINN